MVLKRYLDNPAFLDLTKAFESESHSILLDKLGSFCITGKELALIKSY